MAAIPYITFRCLSFPTHSCPLSPATSPLPLNSYLHIIYTPSFENGSFLKIHLDYQTLKVTSPELSVWLGGWLQTAEQCSRLDINAGLGCAGRREEPALCSLLQPIIFLRVPRFTTRENLILMHSLGKKNKSRENTQYSIPEQRSELASAVKHIHMHMSLYEVQTTDRHNKNDINPNTGSSMKLLMQNAKTHPFFHPDQGTILCSLTFMKARPK